MKKEIEQIKKQILTGINLGRINTHWGILMIDKCDKALGLTYVGSNEVAFKDKETISFNDWVNRNKYTRFGNGYQRNETVFSKEEMWKRFENRK